jgi:hypothetical protein
MKLLAIVIVLTFALLCTACPNPTELPPVSPDIPLEPNISFSLDGSATVSFTEGPTDLAMDQVGLPFITIYDPSSGENALFLYASAEPGDFAHVLTLTQDYCRIRIGRDESSYFGTYSPAEVSIELVINGIAYRTTTASNTLELFDTVDSTPEGTLINGDFEGILEGHTISGSFSLPHQTVDLSVYDS